MSAVAPAPLASTDETPRPVRAGLFRARTRPSLARRVGTPPRPRVRPLAEVLAELVRPEPAPAAEPAVPATPRGDDPPSEDPRTRALVLRLLQAVVEVLDGVRPVVHLRRVCDEVPYATVSAAVSVSAGRTTRSARSRLRGVRLCPVAPGAVEAAAAVHRDGRARALAARLEHDGRDWRFTVLRIL